MTYYKESGANSRPVFFKKPIALGIIAAALSTAISPMSNAQQRGSALLEEVVVFAQKREQSILEVPVSVAAYGSEALDRAQIRDL